MPCNCSGFTVSNYSNDSYSKFGGKTCWIRNYGQDDDLNGVYQVSNTLPAGEYTFSVYAKIDGTFSGSNNPGVFIRVTDTSDNVLAESEHLTSASSEYIRLIAPFEITSAQSVKVHIMISGRGSVDVDGAQLENNPYANAYNMLENGNFERGVSGWSSDTGGVTYSTTTRFNMSKALLLNGNIESEREAHQNITVKKTRSTRETFTLSGWAKGYGLPNHEREGITTPTFRLRAVVYYYDTYYREYGSETFTADFSPCTEEWQFASVQFAKTKYRIIENIKVFCDYDHNTGTAYFDDIQLVRNSLETGLSASDFVVESTGESEENTETTDTTPTFNEAKDKFGNTLTETTFTDGEFGTIYRAFGFSEDGNELIRETDARGNKTRYTVDELTSRNEEIIDRLDNKTAYEYDNAGRTTKVTSLQPSVDENGNRITDENGEFVYEEIANVSYAYDTFDNLTEIARGDGMKYVLNYNAFHELESIGIEGKNDGDLVTYTYKNGNGRLKQITYANGHTMKATYNSIGQMVAEKWFETEAQSADSTATPIAHYKYVYDGQGNIVRSIDMTAQIEYTYTYEDGKIARAAEYHITVGEDEIISAKDLVNSIIYVYDAEGNMTRKRIIDGDGNEQTVYYENAEDTNTVTRFVVPDPTESDPDKTRTVTSHSKTDSFGRKVFDELQLGTGFVSRQFSYHVGAETQQHKDNEKLKSSATTQLVSQIVLSNGTTLSYGYDAEERITSVVETYTVDETPVTNTTIYTYDALGQLLTETVNGEVVNSMEYDNYGNIKAKNGKVYAYGDSVWKDRLTAFDGTTIEYDAQGNPLNYLGNTLTWEKGRQLKKFVKPDGTVIDYTYNANAIRTSKTIDGIRHDFVLDGVKILRETWNGNTLTPLYDNEDSVCGIVYNNTPYYFLKNLQGDVIAIVDKDAEVVARYSYDAWGVCTVEQGSSDIADINPFRYRGYYFDRETRLYYLQSRYYDPVVGRFVNGDEADILGSESYVCGYNLLSYGVNSPVINSDPSGYFALRADLIADTIDIAIALVPFVGNIVKALKGLRALKSGKASLKVYQLFKPAIPKIEFAAAQTLGKWGLRIKIAASLIGILNILLKFSQVLDRFFPFGFSIGGFVALALSKMFKTYTKRERKFIWWGTYAKYTYIKFW